ncbi:hypothetical protein F4777DRAFT_215483 [Nemania sp. FL0916]|nr:hypothetical protein F4777DRAFT_215483 [Nemania sp. FL0916]
MTEQLNSASEKRHRRRPAKSCEPCRARKIKCDRGLPCRPCLRSRASLSCTYKSTRMNVSSGLRADSPLQIDPTPEIGLDPGSPDRPRSGNAESLVEPRCTSEDSDTAAPILSRRISVLEQQLPLPEQDSRQIGLVKDSVRDLEARVSRIEQRISSSLSEPGPSSKPELRIKLPRPYLRVEHEKTRLFGKAHWAHSLEQFNILGEMQSKPYSVPGDSEQAEANRAMLEAASARRHVKTHGTKVLHEPMTALHESLPARGVCDQAVDGYLRTFEPMFRILHVPSFMREYEMYWAQTEPTPTAFLMKLAMVVTIGAIFLTDRPLANDIKKTARNWVYAVQWWLIGPTERDAMSIDGIQVFCLLLLARQSSALGGSASIITEALAKLSFTVGLHLDPRLYPSVTPFESEIRRRLWLTVLELTAITSLNSTLPLLLRASDYHVPLPSNIADSKLDKYNHSRVEAPQATKHDGVDSSVQILLAKSLRLRLQIIHDLNDASREASYEKVIAQSNSLQAHCRELSAFFLARSTDANDGERNLHGLVADLEPTSDFHRKFLDTYFRRLILFLHRPFAHHARRDHRFLLSRQISLDASLIMASHIEAIDPSGDGTVLTDDFVRCCVSGAGMFKGAMGQDVILGVSLEMVTQLEEEEEAGGEDNDDDNHGASDRNSSKHRRRHNATAATRTDPLALLGRSRRKPLVRYLEQIRAQWRQTIVLGRPSLKQYLFVSCILSHVAALEAGRDARAAVLQTIRACLRECTALLRESPAYTPSASTDWLEEMRAGEGGLEDTSPDSIDAMALFGFDFNLLVGCV